MISEKRKYKSPGAIHCWKKNEIPEVNRNTVSGGFRFEFDQKSYKSYNYDNQVDIFL
jgi:hypothetical protein